MKIMNLHKIILSTILAVIGLVAEAQSVGRTNVPPAITLSWTPSPTPNVIGYNIYVGGSSRNYTNVVTVGNVLTFTYTNLIRGATNYFSVTALGSKTESDYSNEVHTNTVPNAAGPTLTVTGIQ